MSFQRGAAVAWTLLSNLGEDPAGLFALISIKRNKGWICQ
jgi:hypothetical protein